MFRKQFRKISFNITLLLLISIVVSNLSRPVVQAQGPTLTGDLTFYTDRYYTPDSTPDVAKVTEGIVKEYEALHPGVTITLVPGLPQSSDFAAFLTTRMAAHQVPDIMWEQFADRNTKDASFWVPLNKYLDQPNPYIAKGQPGSNKWSDELPDYVLGQTRAGDGNYYQLSLDWVETALFYNADMFQKYGISPTWDSWSAFVADMQKLSAATKNDALASYMAQQGWSPWYWSDDAFLSAVWYDAFPSFEIEKYKQAGRAIRQLNPEEIAKAILNGKLSATDPRMDEFLRISKQYVSILPKDYSSLTSLDDVQSLFLSQKAGAVWGGTWMNKPILQNASFKVGVTYFPPFTKDDLKTGAAPAFRVGGPNGPAQWGITKDAEKAGKLDLAIDFLRFMSAPQNFGRMNKIDGGFLPMVIGTSAGDVTANFTKVAALPERIFNDPSARLTTEAGDQWAVAMQAYFTGQADAAATKQQLQKIWMDGATKLCQQQKYDWCK